MTDDTLYEEDLALWAEQQADHLRRAARERSNLPLDWENLAEEIESLGRSQKREVRSLNHQIMAHLVKLAYSPATPNWFGWESEISLYRQQLDGALEDSPSLRPLLPAIVEREVPKAVRTAVLELRKFREMAAAEAVARASITFTPEQVLDPEFFLPGTHERIRAEMTVERR